MDSYAIKAHGLTNFGEIYLELLNFFPCHVIIVLSQSGFKKKSLNKCHQVEMSFSLMKIQRAKKGNVIQSEKIVYIGDEEEHHQLCYYRISLSITRN